MHVQTVRLLFSLAALSISITVAAEEALPPVAWQGVTEIATGPGTKGPWRQNESRYAYVDDPAVAIDEQGRVAVAWADQARKDVFFQRLPAAGGQPVGEPINLSRSPDTFSWLPRIALAPDAPKAVYVLWQEIIFSGGSHGGDILFARSEDGGASFSAPINLSSSIGGDGKGRITRELWHNGSLDLLAGADGALYAAWTEYDGPLWFSRSSDGGKSFSPPRRLAGAADGKPARAPALALGPDGVVYLAWTSGAAEGGDIQIAVSTDGGASFSTPRVVVATAGYSDAPRLAVDAGGTVHLVYADSVGGPFEPFRIHYTRSVDRGHSFKAPRVISEPAPEGTESAAFPQLGLDTSGNLYVAWEPYPDHLRRPHGLAFAVSRNSGQSFTELMLVPGSRDPDGGSNGGLQGLLMQKLAVNSAGHLVIANSSFRDGEQSRVWLIRGELQQVTSAGRQ